MIVKNCKDTIKEFRSMRGQTTSAPKTINVPPTRNRRQSTPYESFIRKYNDLADSVDSLTTRDLVYYFREIAQENGYKYVISNIKKDMHIMKVLRENYSNKEICVMIEFLYESEQDYLAKDRLSPNLLASQWVNTIYADSQLWLNDEYTIKSKKKFKSTEWDKKDSETTKIGEWD